MSTINWLVPAAALAGIGTLLVLSRPTPRFLGDKVRSGDQVFVPIGAGGFSETGVLIPRGFASAIPPDAGQLVVSIFKVGPDVLEGSIIGTALGGVPPTTNFTPILQGIPAVNVPRSAVTGIVRPCNPPVPQCGFVIT